MVQKTGFTDSLSRPLAFPTFSFKGFVRSEELIINCTYDGACCVLDNSEQKLIKNTSLSIGKLYNICRTEIPNSHCQSTLEVQVVRDGLIAHCSKEHYLSWLFINNFQNCVTNNDSQASDAQINSLGRDILDYTTISHLIIHSFSSQLQYFHMIATKSRVQSEVFTSTAKAIPKSNKAPWLKEWLQRTSK